MVRPTRQGISTAVIGVFAFGVGHVFGIIELYVIGAALVILAIGSWLAVALRPPRLDVSRRLSPPLMMQGMPGRVHIDIANRGRRRSPLATLDEPIGNRSSATVEVAALRAEEMIAATYQVPTERRGVINIGPMTMTRLDPFRLARRTSTIAAETSATVTPATLALSQPNLDGGPLGTHLRAAAQRLGPGEFHALRDYVDGDEPRSIHWKASARTETLKVRQYELQRLQHCTVVLDITAAAYADSPDGADSFERAVSCAASLVVTASQADLTTRFVAGSVIDLRGPEVGADTLRTLAEVNPIESGFEPPSLGHTGDGLGLLIVVTARPRCAVWTTASQLRDPTTTAVEVCTDGADDSWNTVDASSLVDFQTNWERFVGSSHLVSVGVHR